MSSCALQPAIDAVLERAVASGAVPNVVAIAADRDGIIYEYGVGPRAPGEVGAVDADTRFRIMSMTKMVVTVTALVLMEQYKLDLDAPVEEYCPEFADVAVLERIESGRPVLRAPRFKATVAQLITHTSGLGYWFWNAAIREWEQAVGAPTVLSGSAAVLRSPMVSDPGAAFVYGLSTDWLGKVVEAASGRSLDDAVSLLVTGPLGMAKTGFTITEPERAQLVPVHLAGDDGRWAASAIELPVDPEYRSGGHGLYSTPRDYLTFQRMLLGGGTSSDGVTLLPQDTVEAVFANQIGALDVPAEIPSADPATAFGLRVGPGQKWGYGLLLNCADRPGGRRAGSGAWAGLFNTHFWIDPAAGLTGAIYSQTLPFISPPALQMYLDFETALYASR